MVIYWSKVRRPVYGTATVKELKVMKHKPYKMRPLTLPQHKTTSLCESSAVMFIQVRLMVRIGVDLLKGVRERFRLNLWLSLQLTKCLITGRRDVLFLYLDLLDYVINRCFILLDKKKNTCGFKKWIIEKEHLLTITSFDLICFWF